MRNVNRLHPVDPLHPAPFRSRVNRRRNREPGRRSVPTLRNVERREARVLGDTFRPSPHAAPSRPAPTTYGVATFVSGRGNRAQVRPVSQLNSAVRGA